MIVDTRKKTGRGRTTWPYFDAMEELLGQDPAVHPPVIVSAGVCSTASVCVSPQATSTVSASTRVTAAPSTTTSTAATATSSSASAKKRKQDQPPAWAEKFLLRQQEQADAMNTQLQKIAEEEKRRNDLFEKFLESQKQ